MSVRSTIASYFHHFNAGELSKRSSSLLKHIESLQTDANAQTEFMSTGIAFGGSYCFVARKPPNSTSTLQQSACKTVP